MRQNLPVPGMRQVNGQFNSINPLSVYIPLRPTKGGSIPAEIHYHAHRPNRI